MLALAVSALCAAPVSAGQVYKWVDEQGRIQYGDKPPAQGATKIQVQTAPAADPGMAKDQETQQKLLDAIDEDTKDQKQHDAAIKTQDQQRRANCQKVKKDAEDTRNARFLYESTGDPANPRVLSEEERAKATRSVEAAVQKWCGPAATHP